MEHDTLKIAREDWAHCPTRSNETLCADDLIALAAGCLRQNRWPSAPLTPEDAAILLRMAPAGLRIDSDGNYIAFGNCQDSALRFVLSLNA
jgi:hypothetical protein